MKKKILYCLEFYDGIEKEIYFYSFYSLKKFIHNNNIFIISLYSFKVHNFIFICDYKDYDLVKKIDNLKLFLKECD